LGEEHREKRPAKTEMCKKRKGEGKKLGDFDESSSVRIFWKHPQQEGNYRIFAQRAEELIGES